MQESAIAPNRFTRPESGVAGLTRPHWARGSAQQRQLEDLKRENRALRKRVEELLLFQDLALTDPLTRLGNRRRFERTQAREWMRWKRYRTPFSVMVIDLNGFKQINDTWGHAFGDLALCSLAKHLSECCREVDEVCRIGGDEFALLLPHTGPNGAQVLADRMAATLPQLPNPTLGGPPIKLVASFGIAATDAGVPDAEHMMHAADAAMYDSKRGQALSQRKSSI